MIFGVTGLARSGKDTFADMLVRHYGFVKLNMSDCLRDELKRLGKPSTKDNMSILGDEWRSLWGYDIIIRRTLEDAKRFSKVVITGFRSPQEVEFMKKNNPSFFLVTLVASDETRFSRRNSDDPEDFDSFIGRDMRDVNNKGLGKVIAAADYVIDNDIDGDMKDKAKEFLSSL